MYFVFLYALFLTLPKVFLSILQWNFLKKEREKEAYILEKEQFKKAADYGIIQQKLSFFESFVDLAVIAFFILFGFSFLDENITLSGDFKSVAFVLSFLVISSLVSLPFNVYRTLIVDKKFGFNKGGVKVFVQDFVKAMLMLLIIGGAVIYAFSFVIGNIQNWEIYAFILAAVLIVLINVFYPTVIAPMFNKFTPLEDKNLAGAIDNLLERVGFHSKGVFVMDASKRDGRLNAYFGGIGRNKRVILFDTLLEKIPQNSLLAVLGHELGHFKHKDVFKMMAMVLAFLAFLFFLVGNLPQSLFASANLTQSPYALIVFLLILSGPIGFYFGILINLLSCQNEFNADKFGASLTSNEDLAKALLKLVKENNAFPLAHPLYMKFYYSHPPLMARLMALHCENLINKENS